MNRVRNRRIQSNVGLVVSIGSTVYVIRIGLKYNGILSMLNDIGRNQMKTKTLKPFRILSMLNDIGRNLMVEKYYLFQSILPMLNGTGQTKVKLNSFFRRVLFI